MTEPENERRIEGLLGIISSISETADRLERLIETRNAVTTSLFDAGILTQGQLAELEGITQPSVAKRIRTFRAAKATNADA